MTVRFNTFSLFIPYAVYLFAAFLTFIVVEEDAFIYFRLAQNLADGYGIVFNRGGEHIESGSGLIWLLLLSLLASLPVHLVIATKLLGVGFALLSLWQLLKLSDRFIDNKSLVIFPALFLAASTPFYFWSHRGLETAQYVFVLLWLLNWLTDKEKINRWYIPAFILICSRPEGFLFVIAIAPCLWMERNRIAGFRKGILIFLSLCFALLCWRLYYFHDLLPHAFYHKMGSGKSRGLQDLLQYGLWNLLWLWLAFSIVCLSIKKVWKRDYIPIVLLLLASAVWSIIGADWKSFNRQVSTFLPFAFLFVVLGAGQLTLRPMLHRMLLGLLGIYAAFLFVFSPYTTSRGDMHLGPNVANLKLFAADPIGYSSHVFSATINPDGYFDQEEPTLAGDHIGFNRNATVGRFIGLNYRENITVIFDQMGQAPWYAGLDKDFIDNAGLTDKEIGYFEFSEKPAEKGIYKLYFSVLWALKGFFWEESPAYSGRVDVAKALLDRAPALILARERYVARFPNTVMGLVVNSQRFKDHYRPAFYLNKRDVVFQRNDLPVIDQPKVPPGAYVVKAGVVKADGVSADDVMDEMVGEE